MITNYYLFGKYIYADWKSEEDTHTSWPSTPDAKKNYL